MKKFLFLLLVPFLLNSCNAQQAKNNNEPEKGSAANEPKVNVKVNKQCDDDGNLIAYDSTYVWSYSNESGNPVDVNIDSVLSQFKPMIGENYPQFYNEYQKNLFSDSLFYEDFLMPDYFMNRWQQQLLQMNRMMLEMDSIKQTFFRERYPELERQKSK